MNGFTHLGRRGGPFAPSLKLGRGVFCNRSGSGLFRRDGLPPFPRVCNFTQLVAEEFNTGARIFVGGVEAAKAALAPGAETNITFVVDCRRDQGLVPTPAGCSPPLADSPEPRPLDLADSPGGLVVASPRARPKPSPQASRGVASRPSLGHSRPGPQLHQNCGYAPCTGRSERRRERSLDRARVRSID